MSSETPAHTCIPPDAEGVKSPKSGLCPGGRRLRREGGSGVTVCPQGFACPELQVFSEYFKELEEESIRDNFVIIYELLDELMDFGFPQTTDSKILQE